MNTYVYEIDGNLYINLTNECSNRCEFCVRTMKDDYEGYDLWLEKEPSAEDVLNAIRYHTSGRPGMSELEKLIFLADMLEEARDYNGVELLRALFWKGENLDECLLEALMQTLQFLRASGKPIYALTQQAYEYYKREEENYGRNYE